MHVLLLGYPVGHSLSPVFQNAAFRHLALDHQYLTHEVPAFDSTAVGDMLRRPDVLGANITVPHKQAMLAVVDRLTPVASAVGAVNTVYREQDAEFGERLVGHNTDVDGLSRDLDRVGCPAGRRRALLLGSGGAARAALVALTGRFDEVVVVNRTRARADAMVADLASCCGPGKVQVRAWGDDPGSWMGQVALVCDSTSLGLHPDQDQTAIDALTRLGIDKTGPDCFFYDLKYGRVTPLLGLAQALGRPRADGLGMLVLQGAASFTRWTGLEAPVRIMFAAVGERFEGY